jgi:hypothetical protein
MKHPTESVTSSYVRARDSVRICQRLGQWLVRAGVRDALMGPVLVVEVLELPYGVQEVRLVPDQEPSPAADILQVHHEVLTACA